MITPILLNLPEVILELVSGAGLRFYSNLCQIQKRTRPLASKLSPGGQHVHRPPGSGAAWEITDQMSICLTAALGAVFNCPLPHHCFACRCKPVLHVNW